MPPMGRIRNALPNTARMARSDAVASVLEKNRGLMVAAM
jgi:hypothetical protein